ncbi:MAG: DNA polymerase III subunit gamma/tau [Cytophagales bacterium]|nr:DNA polymerase III subunit gamma/tau [Cytophagales bacterium]
MSSYIVLARKYRPATFNDVVGQDNIITQLKHEILNEKIGHAYLFCGPRGTGKTSTARILAKTINCKDINREDCAPCGQCDVCANTSMTFFELDAASNNSVEDIRQITEEARMPSPFARYKVFIIDEVHMLSSSAFNAFLKTLEEPQERVVFILATTEANKVPATVVSRCQTFNFRLIDTEIIKQQLQKIFTKEGITYEPGTVDIIAQQGHGSMRDALSIADAIIGNTNNTLTIDKVKNILNIIDEDVYINLCKHITAGDKKNTILLFEKIYHDGVDCLEGLNGLEKFFMDIFYIQHGIKICPDKYRDILLELDIELVEKALKIIHDAIIDYRNTINKKLHTEIILLQIINATYNEKN